MAEALRVPAYLVPPGSPQAKQLCHLHAQLSLGQSCHRQKKKSCIYVHRVTSVVSHSLQPCILCPARLLCQGRGFSRQEYWSILAYTGCHILLEHYISRCPSRQGTPCCPSRQGTLLSTSCCQNPCNPSSCTTSTPGPHRGNRNIYINNYFKCKWIKCSNKKTQTG